MREEEQTDRQTDTLIGGEVKTGNSIIQQYA